MLASRIAPLLVARPTTEKQGQQTFHRGCTDPVISERLELQLGSSQLILEVEPCMVENSVLLGMGGG